MTITALQWRPCAPRSKAFPSPSSWPPHAWPFYRPTKCWSAWTSASSYSKLAPPICPHANGRFVELSAFEGGKMAIAEVTRNLVCSGAEPIGITDCLNFASPENPATMDQLATAIDGLAEGCRVLDVPIVSGNVSLYNETSDAAGRHPILPTPTVAAVGLIADEKDIVTSHFKANGDAILLLGTSVGDGLGGSEYQALKAKKLGGPATAIDLEAEKKLQTLVLGLARSHVLSSAHDVSDGGLAVCLAESCVLGGKGAEVSVEPTAAALFGEGPSRIVVSTSQREQIEKQAKAAGVPVLYLGTVTEKTDLRLGSVAVSLADLARARDACLSGIVGTTSG